MSLSGRPEPSLAEMRARLESLLTPWLLATTPAAKADADEDFKALAEKITQRWGAEGKKIVDAVLAKRAAMERPRS